jgi:hypothetical protein
MEHIELGAQPAEQLVEVDVVGVQAEIGIAIAAVWLMGKSCRAARRAA